MPSRYLPQQPEINIGTCGHVDHGKTTLVQALTGVWAARHSEELRRGISIRIGYADTAFRRCPSCEAPQCYTIEEVCPVCKSKTEFLRAVSFVDCPGHEILMTTMLSGAAVMDGAVLVIAANESVPQPQTREHLVALEIIGVKNVVIAQNKIDVVPREQVLKNYEQIKEFVEGTIAENSPVIPTSAQHGVNLDILMEAFEKFLPTPDRDLKKPPRMFVVRSFDVNKPGLPVEKIVGGVLGGTVLQGEFEVGDEIEMSPGIRVRDEYEGLFTEIVSLQAGGKFVEKVKCGGLVGVGTKLDPSLTKADGLVGNVVGRPGTLPLPLNSITIEATLFDRAIGTRELVKVEKIAVKESLVLNLGTTVTAGVVTSVKDDLVSVSLRRPVCAEEGMQVAISRRISGRWRLIGYGKVRL